MQELHIVRKHLRLSSYLCICLSRGNTKLNQLNISWSFERATGRRERLREKQQEESLKQEFSSSPNVKRQHKTVTILFTVVFGIILQFHGREADK